MKMNDDYPSLRNKDIAVYRKLLRNLEFRNKQISQNFSKEINRFRSEQTKQHQNYQIQKLSIWTLTLINGLISTIHVVKNKDIYLDIYNDYSNSLLHMWKTNWQLVATLFEAFKGRSL